MTRVCITCNEVASRGPRCLQCFRAWRSASAQRLRKLKKQRELDENEQLATTGWRRCSMCLRKRQLSEFRTSQPKRRGKLNKICDACLTRIYTNPARAAAATIRTPEYWRKRAYCANTNARSRLARERHVTAANVQLSELEWICKPQDLAQINERQHGLCFYCGVPLVANATHVEHDIPLSRGGRHCFSNLRLACADCNQLKHTRTGEEFIKFLQLYAMRVLARATESQNKESAS